MAKLGAVLMGIVIVVVLAAFVSPTTARLRVNLATSERPSEKTLFPPDNTRSKRRIVVRLEPTVQTASEAGAQADNFQPVVFLPLVCNTGKSVRLFLPFVSGSPPLPPGGTCPTRTPGPPLPRPTQPPSIIPTPPPSPLATPVVIR